MASNGSRAPTVDRIVEQTQTVYSLPLFYDRLNEKINHPRSSLADIGQVISEDQGLTVRLLKLANSPLFGYHANIGSITKALTVIGTRQLRDLALAVSVVGSFRGIPNGLVHMETFWKHNIACGILSRNIATYRREVNQERFFIAGMLHDIGFLVMCSAIPESVQEIVLERRDRNELKYVTEHQHLGFDHGAVGGALLAKWKIPLTISEPVACHHAPAEALRYPLEAATIHLADLICHTMGYSMADSAHIPPLDPRAWDLLEIPVNQLGTIIKQSEIQIEETCAIISEAL
ncbi:MAG TPA: HDOD domain-containing protein [Desulfuromonadales bacterium]|nr:HDOD domain-containing protein [Desulfuromonadales bacterium]